MKKTLACVILITLSASTFAITAEEKITQEKENMKILASMGLPLPGSGIKLVPRIMLNLSPEDLAKGEKEEIEFREKGYVNTYTNRPRELLNLNTSLDKELKLSARNLNETSTGLRRNIQDIKLAFTFPGTNNRKTLHSISSSNITMLAAAPKGGFHEDKGGWSGASQFFNYKGIGTCSYSVMNVKASNTAAQLAQEDVTYTINNKATILLPVEGSENSGFLYMLKWYDENNFHELECANMNYSSQTNEAVIELAKKIDSNA